MCQDKINESSISFSVTSNDRKPLEINLTKGVQNVITENNTILPKE